MTVLEVDKMVMKIFHIEIFLLTLITFKIPLYNSRP